MVLLTFAEAAAELLCWALHLWGPSTDLGLEGAQFATALCFGSHFISLQVSDWLCPYAVEKFRATQQVVGVNLLLITPKNKSGWEGRECWSEQLLGGSRTWHLHSWECTGD